MKTRNSINSGIVGRLEPTVTPSQDYLAIILETTNEKRIRAIAASYVPATGGSVTTASLRIGRIKIVGGIVKPSEGSLALDPFTVDLPLPGAEQVFFDQLIRNQLLHSFGDEGLVIPRGVTCSIIIGASVGEADSSSAPSASIGYLSVAGQILSEGADLDIGFR